MEEIKKQNSCDLIQTQNDEYEALLGLEKAKSEQAEMTKRRMTRANDLLGPEPGVDSPKSDLLVIRIYTPDGCYRRKFSKCTESLLEDIHLYLASLGYFEVTSLRTYEGDNVKTLEDLMALQTATSCTNITNGLVLYIPDKRQPH